jgi:phosphoglycolate phosphatase-like HAD superfamily hydrolase
MTPGALVLFDIDGTLLATRGAGTRSMLDAARELFGERFTFDGVEVAGRIDPAIWADVARANGIADPQRHHDRFRAAYQRHLERRLAAENTIVLMPGAVELIRSLGGRGAALGLVTGNYPEAGLLKFRHAGLDPGLFSVAAWGCDAPDRRGLPELAMRLHRARSGVALAPRRVVVVGDTPSDVDCASACGCRSLGVATGSFSRADLAACGADLAVDDLTGTAELLRWILG